MNFSEPKRLTHLNAQFTSVAFSPDGEKIAFACIVRRRCAVCLMDRDGGALTLLAGRDNVIDDTYWDLQFSPDASFLVCIRSEEDGEFSDLCLIDVGTRVQTRLTHTRNVTRPCLSPNGQHIVFQSGEKCIYDMFRISLETEEITRLTHTPPEWRTDTNGFDPSHPGNVSPCYSPDGEFIAFASSAYDGKTDHTLQVCLMRADGSGLTRLTHDIGGVHDLRWHPNGKQIAFRVHEDLDDMQGRRAYHRNLHLVDRDGSNLRRLETSNSVSYRSSFRPGDGRYLAYSSFCEVRFPKGGRNWNIRLLDVETGEVFVVTDDDVYDSHPLFSPDGRTLLFVSDRATGVMDHGDWYSLEVTP